MCTKSLGRNKTVQSGAAQGIILMQLSERSEFEEFQYITTVFKLKTALYGYKIHCNHYVATKYILEITLVSECSVLGNGKKLHHHMEWNKSNWPFSFC